MRTLILGLGNAILRDDGIGPRIIEELQRHISDPEITLLEASLAGMNLMETLVGFQRAVIIDAIQAGGKPGTTYLLSPENLPSQRTTAVSQHQIGLLQALQLGKELAQPMPEIVTIIAVEAEDVCSFSEELTPLVEQAVPRVVKLVLSEIESIR